MRGRSLLKAILVIASMGLFEVGGNVTALISFNYWMQSFTHGSAALSVQIISGLFYFILFVPACLALLVWHWRRGSADMSVLLKPRHILNGCLIACADTWIDLASTFAAPHTPVLTQVFAKALEPLMTYALSMLVLRDGRSWRTPWPPVAFLCIVGAVGLHMYRDIAEKYDRDGPSVFFVVLYISGVCGSTCYSISQSRFIRCLRQDAELTAIERNAAGETRPLDTASVAETTELDDGHGLNDESTALLPGAAVEERPLCADDLAPVSVVRVMALAIDMGATLLLTLLLGPLLNMIPGLGSSAGGYAASWADLRSGMQCMWSCEGTMGYGVITLAGWALVYSADTVLNHFSPTLNSMINEFTAPVGVLILLARPAWDLGSGKARTLDAVLLNMASVALLVIGVTVYAVFELRTSRHLDAIEVKRAADEETDADEADEAEGDQPSETA